MKERVFFVDGMSNLYRAYYAIRGLSNKKGFPTNAIYGFTTMLKKLIEDERPDYIGVAIDLFGKTVRHEEYEGYKATRKPMPDDLVVQVPYILKVCQALRIPVLSYDKYEADDVIGTLAAKAAQEGYEAIIATIDKDMMQLVEENIRVLNTRDYTYFDRNKVEQKLGVPPEKVVELLGLWGDSSDNIPGAPGIGEKGAQQLIQQYGTIDNLLEHTHEISRKTYRESLLNNRELILTSKKLVTIRTDLPVDLNLEDLKVKEADTAAAMEIFSELEFTAFLKEYAPARPQAVTAVIDYAGVSSLEELQEILQQARQQKQAAVCFLLNAENYLDSKLLGVGISLQPHWARALTAAQAHIWRDALLGLMSDSSITKVFHDVKPALLVLENEGIEPPHPYYDTMLAAYLLNPNQSNFAIDKLALEYLQHQVSDQCIDSTAFPALEEATCMRIACEIADITGQLHALIAPEIAGRSQAGLKKLYDEIELPLVPVLADMERQGVKVDIALFERMSAEMEQEIEQLTRRIHELAGEEFNINSPKQLGEILFEKLNIPALKKTKKSRSFSTGVEVLEQLASDYEIPRLILEYRALAKLKSTYLDVLPKLVNSKTGRIHTSYHQMVAATGRLSSSNPNLQNIPIKGELGRKIRQGFIAEPGNLLVTADYSQIELRVMAHLSQDPALIDAFRKGEDIHHRTSVLVFGERAAQDPAHYRRLAKVFNFGIMYGLSAFGLSRDLKIPRAEAQKFINDYFERYAAVKKWLDETIQFAREHGYVQTMFGRMRQIPEINNRNWNVASFAERTAINAPIQGTAADLIKMAMIRIHGRLKAEEFRSCMILQVHDELVFEGPEDEANQLASMVQHEMENVYPLDVPIKAETRIGKVWSKE
ncbi:MAG TPA: DNA polymerase I [Acidobacteriota bacterium]|nr:DNA polymerase I [Acidobacteriota bacterium]